MKIWGHGIGVSISSYVLTYHPLVCVYLTIPFADSDLVIISPYSYLIFYLIVILCSFISASHILYVVCATLLRLTCYFELYNAVTSRVQLRRSALFHSAIPSTFLISILPCDDFAFCYNFLQHLNLNILVRYFV